MKPALAYTLALVIVLCGGAWYMGQIERDRDFARQQRLDRFDEFLRERDMLLERLFSAQKKLSGELGRIEREYRQRNGTIKTRAKERVEQLNADRLAAGKPSTDADLSKLQYGNLLAQRSRLVSQMEHVSRSHEQKEKMILVMMKDNSEVMAIKAKSAFREVYASPRAESPGREAARVGLGERIAEYESDMLRRNRLLEHEIGELRQGYREKMVGLSVEMDRIDELIVKLKPRYRSTVEDAAPVVASIMRQMDAELKASRHRYVAQTKVLCDQMELSVNDTGAVTREMETGFDEFRATGMEEDARFSSRKTYAVSIMATLSVLFLCGIGAACWGPDQRRQISLHPY